MTSDTARVDCWATISPELKAPPEKIPEVKPGDNKFEEAAESRAREGRKDRKFIDLQAEARACGDEVRP